MALKKQLKTCLTPNMQQNVILFIPYFGKWPSYFPIFLFSTRYNDKIRFYFLTDCPIPDNYPDNVTFQQFSLQNFKSLVESKLGIKPLLNSGYKVCDFRPAFAVLFSEILGTHSYWGYCDIDLILGETNRFLSFINYQDYDIISCRPEWITGSFALFKNTPKINRLFQGSNKFAEVFKSQVFMSFDECGAGNWSYFLYKTLNAYLAFPKDDSITHLVAHDPTIKIWNERKIIKESLFDAEILKFSDGKIRSLLSGDEFLHFHYVIEKRRARLFKFPVWDSVPNDFFISKAGFWRDDVTLKDIERRTALSVQLDKVSTVLLGIPIKAARKLISLFTSRVNRA